MFGYQLLIALEMIVSVLIIVVILMQSSKGGGLAGSFGGASMGTVFGVRRTADFLAKATAYLAIIFVGICLATNLFFLPGKQGSTTDSIIQTGTPTSVPKPAPPRSQPAAVPQQKAK